MGTYVIRTPDIGEGIAEVELVAWHVKPGDAVTEDQVLADVMTDKASVEIPSPVSGKVLALGGDVGQVLAVGSELIRIEVASSDATSQRALERAVSADAVSAARPPAVPPLRVAAQEAPRAAAAQHPIASPSVRRRAWELGVELRDLHGSGPGGRIMHGDLEVHAAKAGASAPARAASAPPALSA